MPIVLTPLKCQTCLEEGSKPLRAFSHSALLTPGAFYAKKVCPDQTAPLGAVWSGYILFDHAWPKNKHYKYFVDTNKNMKEASLTFLQLMNIHEVINNFSNYSGMNEFKKWVINELCLQTEKIMMRISH